ncbi:hypothetical protein VKA52_13025 [Halobacillus sp. HZG1]|uniref:hypothetical protein n=1 Tax=Halobacillus sp. HZG1 TaxID=3111769 RepID=UPI002DB9773E|nr:hypothetical protein [Halobacillus sp. HZG1]MEC3884648.1 hypothetical protein [Halobacillus sp. HZG1]
MTMDTLLLFYKIQTETVSAKDYISWAETELIKGRESPSLFIITSLSEVDNIFEVEAYFKRACKELEIDHHPSFESCARAYLHGLAERILNSQRASEGFTLARHVFTIVVDLDDPDDLMAWHFISDQIDQLFYDLSNNDLSGEGIVRRIKEECSIIVNQT